MKKLVIILSTLFSIVNASQENIAPFYGIKITLEHAQDHNKVIWDAITKEISDVVAFCESNKENTKENYGRSLQKTATALQRINSLIIHNPHFHIHKSLFTDEKSKDTKPTQEIEIVITFAPTNSVR